MTGIWLELYCITVSLHVVAKCIVAGMRNRFSERDHLGCTFDVHTYVPTKPRHSYIQFPLSMNREFSRSLAKLLGIRMRRKASRNAIENNSKTKWTHSYGWKKQKQQQQQQQQISIVTSSAI